MAGELGVFDKIERFGWPWAGRYLSGNLILGNGAACPVSVPAPVSGDSYLLKVPGLPEPDTTPAEAADGIEWRNYRIIAGRNAVLYNQQLGNDSWVYIDAAGHPWTCTLAWSSKTAASLSIKDMWGGQDVVQTIPLTFAPPLAFNAAADEYWIISDINTTGSDLVLALAKNRSRFGPLPVANYIISRVQVSGTPPLAEAAWGLDGIPPRFSVTETIEGSKTYKATVERADPPDQIVFGPTTVGWSDSNPFTAPPGYTTIGSWVIAVMTEIEYQSDALIGAMFVGDDLSIVTRRYRYSGTGSGSFAPDTFVGGYSGSSTGAMEIMVGSSVIFSVPLSQSVSVSSAYSLSTRTWVDAVGGQSNTSNDASNNAGGVGGYLFNIGLMDVDTLSLYSPAGSHTWRALQTSNKTIAVDTKVIGATRTLQALSHLGTSLTVSPYNPLTPPVITSQPVTGAIASASSLTAFM